MDGEGDTDNTPRPGEEETESQAESDRTGDTINPEIESMDFDGYSFCDEDPNDVFYPYHCEKGNCRWDGCDAAFIAFKRKEALPAVPQDNCTGKAPVKEVIERVYKSGPVHGSSRSKIEKSLRGNEDDNDSLPDSQNKNQAWKEGVEALTNHVLTSMAFRSSAAGLLGWISFTSFKESLFRSLAKFVMSVFDQEDFERIFNRDKIEAEWEACSSRLSEADHVTDKKEASGKVEVAFHEFPTLKEHDFYDILQQYDIYMDECNVIREKNGFRQIIPFKYQTLPFEFKLCQTGDFIPESVKSTIIEDLMQNHLSLKEDCKIQLALELMRRKGYRVFDTLVIEFFRGIKVDDLLKLVDEELAPAEAGLFRERYRSPSPRTLISVVLRGLLYDLYALGWWKAMALNYSQNAVTFPLSSMFGPCKAEVLEVIKIADHERRLRGASYFTLEHVELGLCLSRVGDFVKGVPGNREQKYSGGLHSELFIVKMSRLLRQAADALDDEEIGLEHFILAIDYMRRGGEEGTSLVPNDDAGVERLESLRKCNAKTGVDGWDESSEILKFLPESYDGGRVPDDNVIISFLKELHS